ncbi:MAG: TolC family protein [Gemmatimonadota bacterium]
MKSRVRVWVAIIGVPLSAAAQSPGQAVPMVTLHEARRRSAEVDPSNVTARTQVETAAWERRAAVADVFTPRVEANTSYIRFSDPFFNFGTGTISPNATSAQLQASYTLLGAGKYGELKRSRAALTSAEASETVTTYRTALATDAAYFTVLAVRELSRVAAQRLRRAQEQLGIARVRVVAGDALATDSLQLLLEVNRARLAVLQSDSAVAVSRLRLGRQIGLPGSVDASPVDTVAPPALPLSQELAVRELRERGPEIEAMRAAEQSADAAMSVQREGYLPHVSIAATTGAYDAEFFPSAFKRTQFQLNVSLPIWNGGQREVAVARARAQRDLAKAQREDGERAAAQLMSEAYLGYQTSRAGFELARVGVAVASENYRVQRTRYQEGATSILDLMEAQVTLSEAEANLVQSRYAARLALAQIESLLGRRIFETQNPTNR